MKRAESDSVYLASQYFNLIQWPENHRIGFSSEPVFTAYSEIAPALSIIVDLQNQLLPMLRLILGISCNLASSLRKDIRKDLEEKGFPELVVSNVNSYWQQSGRYVRDLRDISEHYMDLSGDAVIEWKNDPGQLLIFLPDNPEDKSPKDLAIIYLRKQVVPW